jgi:hypothetical protein
MALIKTLFQFRSQYLEVKIAQPRASLSQQNQVHDGKGIEGTKE